MNFIGKCNRTWQLSSACKCSNDKIHHHIQFLHHRHTLGPWTIFRLVEFHRFLFNGNFYSKFELEILNQIQIFVKICWNSNWSFDRKVLAFCLLTLSTKTVLFQIRFSVPFDQTCNRTRRREQCDAFIFIYFFIIFDLSGFQCNWVSDCLVIKSNSAIN